MFSFLSKNKKFFSPMTGDIIPIEEIKDSVFSQKILGDGFGVLPTENDVLAPLNGTIVQVFDTKHAVCIQTDDNLEILIHLGIDTVYLKGEGFDVFVKEGDTIKAGQKIMSMDLNFIKDKNIDPTCCVILTNHDSYECKKSNGNAIAGQTVAIQYKVKS